MLLFTVSLFAVCFVKSFPNGYNNEYYKEGVSLSEMLLNSKKSIRLSSIVIVGYHFST